MQPELTMERYDIESQFRESPLFEAFYSFIYQAAFSMILLANKRLEKFLNIRTLC